MNTLEISRDEDNVFITVDGVTVKLTAKQAAFVINSLGQFIYTKLN